MTSRRLLYLMVMLAASLPVWAQEAAKPAAEKHHRRDICAFRKKYTCNTGPIEIACSTNYKKPAPKVKTREYHVCNTDKVEWKILPCAVEKRSQSQAEPQAQPQVLVLFDQETSPLDSQFYLNHGDQIGASVKAKVEHDHCYHYTVWFDNGEKDDPHIIIH
jgi:hypothetical protein